MRCRPLHCVLLFFLLAAAPAAFVHGEATSSPQAKLVDPIRLLPAETLFLLQIPNMATLGEGFYKAHHETLSSPLIAQLNAKLAQNPTVKSPPVIPPAPGSMATILALGEVCAGQIAINMQPGKGKDTLVFLAVGQEPWKPKAAKMVRDHLAKVLKLTWKEDKTTGVWSTKSPFGELYFADLGKTFLVGSHPDAFEGAHSALKAQKTLPKSLADVPLYQAARAKHEQELLYFCFSNFQLAQPWLDASTDNKLNLQGKLLKERMSGMQSSSWSWKNAGPGHISLDRLVITLDQESAKAMRTFVRPTTPALRKKMAPHALSSFQVNVDATKMSQVPALNNLVGASWLEKWGALPGQGEWMYAVVPGEQAGDVSQQILVSSKETTALKKCLEEGPLALPLLPEDWTVKVTEDGLWFSDTGRDAHLSAPPNMNNSNMNAFLKATTPSTAPFIDLVVNRPEMIKRAIVIAEDNYDELAERLRKQGFKVPDSMPAISKPEELFGLTRATVYLEGPHLLLDTSYKMNNTYSSLMTVTTVLASFLFQDSMVSTLETWQRAALPPGGQDQPNADYNIFNLTVWTGILINPVMVAFGAPSTFVDLLATQLFIHPPLENHTK